MKKEILIIILARGGSKRLKNKNLRIFNGKPLVIWTIEQALDLKGSFKIVLSSENANIKKVAKKYKNIILMDRPLYLAKDNTSSLKVMQYIIKKLSFEGKVVLLQPTSPLRKKIDIKNALNRLSRGSKAVMSICRSLHCSDQSTLSRPGQKFYSIDRKKRKIYTPNGAVYAATTQWIQKNESFYNDTVDTFEMPLERSIDIDYEFQFLMAERLLELNDN